jgi:hypothetical protein
MRCYHFILIFVFLIASCDIIAQPRLRTPEIHVGAHAGVMASTTIFKPSIQGAEIPNVLLSPNGGLVFRYIGHKVCAIQVEANYMQRGWAEKLDNVNYTRQLDYIAIPLLMNLYFGERGIRGFFNLGPQIGYCFRDIATGTTNPEYKHQYTNIHKPFDWGLAGGLGIYYQNYKVGLFQLEVRCNYSFGSIFNTQMTDHFEFANPLNLSLNLAYMWQFKLK